MDEETKEKIVELFSLYKIPLILTGLGVLFLIAAIGFFIKLQTSSQEVIFSSESSASAALIKPKIHVDIEGAVISPGVYGMTEGERISDALAIAGGLSADADREWIAKNLNRAAKLVDGGKIYIPSQTEVSSGKLENRNLKLENDLGSLSNPSNLLGVTIGKVNINNASQSDLEVLPGVGPVTAGKIISGRPYQTIDELKSKKVVGKAVFEKIKDLITL